MRYAEQVGVTRRYSFDGTTTAADGTQWTVTGLLREFNTTSRIMLSLEFLPAEYDPDATPAWLVIGPDVTTGELREAYEAYYGVAEGK